MKNEKGFVVPLFLAVIAILLVGGGAYIYLQEESESESPVAKTGVVSGEASQSSDSETQNWKTYTNTRYGFSFQYPLEWAYSSSDNGYSGGSNLSFYTEGNVSSLQMSFHTYELDITPQEDITYNYAHLYTDASNNWITISDFPVLYFSSRFDHRYVLYTEDSKYEFVVFNAQEEVVEKIIGTLSTKNKSFNFIEVNSVESR